MFKDCTSLEYLILSNDFVSGFTYYLEETFMNCISLRSLDLNNFDTSTYKSLDSIFYNCTSLTSLNIPNLKTSGMTSFKSLFYGCSSLTSLYLPYLETNHLDYSNYENIFDECRNLESSIYYQKNTYLIENIPNYIKVKPLD